ncbi:MAG: L,D-transpeptidase [Pseudomonadales bacterium]|nr:L,D-transpeptidase [Pseudomonadales bacterium]
MSEHVKLVIGVSTQNLSVSVDGRVAKTFSVSTGIRGTGQQFGSEKTPLGKHYICSKIGADVPEMGVFVGRRFSGEIFTPKLSSQYPERDWILSRILWLSGLEPGFNRNGEVDTLRRYIYIHGTPDSEPMGIPASHGCIRMRNYDLIELFDLVEKGTEVMIKV